MISPVSTSARYRQESNLPENRGVRKFCMSAQIDTDLSPCIPIIPVFGCSLPEASRLFFPFPFGLLLEHNTVVKRERELKSLE